MIQLRLLGTLGLRDDHGADHPALLVRSKQVALLAYLCTATPRGFHQRNTLLALFWPESDEQRARLSLRKALHGLRAELGADALLARGDDEIAANFDVLWCDATTFETELDAGHLDAAMALYAGPLLNGVVIPGLSDFHIWLDGRRDALRRRAAEAAETLATRAEERGDLADALSWLRRLESLSPYEEQPLRRQLLLLERLGDRVAAVRAYERWAARLRADLDGEASPETVELVDRIRGEGPRSRDELLTAREIPREDLPASSVPPPPRMMPRDDVPSSSESRPPPTRRAVRLAVAAGITLVVGIAAAAVLTRGSVDLPPAEGTVVLPFQYLGDKETEYLGGAMSLLMSSSLGEQGPLASVDPRAVAGLSSARKPSDGDDLRFGVRVARQLGARYFIAGTVVRAHRSVRVESGLYDVARGVRPVARAVGEGDVDSVFAIAERVANDLLAERIGGTPTAALGTTSLTALRAYLDGERELLGSRYAQAADAFARAVAADTMFRRGYYRLGYAAGWAGRSQIALSATARALNMSAHLDAPDQLLLRAWSDFLNGSVIDASREYEEFLGHEPQHVEAWLQLGELRYHWGSQLGVSRDETEQAFRHVLALAPDQAAALIHLARLEARKIDGFPAFDSLARAALATQLDPVERMELHALIAARRGDSASVRAVLADATERPAAIGQVVGVLFTVPGAQPLAERLARLELRDEGTAVGGYIQLAQIAATHGQFARALAIVDTLGHRNAARAAELRAWIALLPQRTPTVAEMRAVRAGVEATPADEWVMHGDRSAEARGIYPPRRMYLIGALALQSGDTARAARAADQLAGTAFARVSDSTSASFARRFSAQLRAELQLSRGDAAGALGTLQAAAPEPGGTFPGVMSFVHARERYTRGEALARSGRLADAIRWFDTFPDPSSYDSWIFAAALTRRAELRERMGDAAAAKADRARFAELWKDADPG